MAVSAVPCPYVTPPTTGGNCDTVREDGVCTAGKDIGIRFGSRTTEWCDKTRNNTGADLTWANHDDGYVSPKFEDETVTLAKLLPKYTAADGTEYEHTCVKYAAKSGVVQKHSDPQVSALRQHVFARPHPSTS